MSDRTETLEEPTPADQEAAARDAQHERAACGMPIDLDFSTFVVSIGTSALVGLGLADNPETGGRVVDLELAKQNIDILAMLCQKTQGNLDASEEKLLRTMLYDLRMAYVKMRG